MTDEEPTTVFDVGVKAGSGVSEHDDPLHYSVAFFDAGGTELTSVNAIDECDHLLLSVRASVLEEIRTGGSLTVDVPKNLKRITIERMEDD